MLCLFVYSVLHKVTKKKPNIIESMEQTRRARTIVQSCKILVIVIVVIVIIPALHKILLCRLRTKSYFVVFAQNPVSAQGILKLLWLINIKSQILF